MKVLVINCGSSSLKYQLIRMEDEEVLAKGIVERIGIDGSMITYKANGNKIVKEKKISNHKEAIKLVLDTLMDKEIGVIESIKDIYAVGHRIVHGGEKCKKSVLINESVKQDIIDCYKIAPLHNPANVIGINACEEVMKDTKMVAVFDTAFHESIKKEQYLYAIPYSLYEKFKIRKYGFHGTSHNYVSHKVAEVLKKDIKDLKIISCHLGNGASICAIKNGKSFDTSMGFSPLDGIVMGTRSGSIDPTIVTYLEDEGYTKEQINNMLNRESGALGLSGVSSDFRDIEREARKGNEKAKLALDVYHYSIKKMIGSYIAALGGVDVIIFTAGVGENSSFTRKESLKGLEGLGIEIDDERNNVKAESKEISSNNSKVKVFVIPTNEELQIAKETLKVISGV